MNRSTRCEIESTRYQAEYEKKGGLLGSLNMLTGVTPFQYSLCCSNVTFIAMLYVNEVSKLINIYCIYINKEQALIYHFLITKQSSTFIFVRQLMYDVKIN